MKDIMGLMKQAKKMQENMEVAKLKVADLTASGASGGGLVTVTLAGGGNMQGLKIDPSLMVADEVDMLEDLIVAAYQTAKVELDSKSADVMKESMGDIQLPPGMGL